VQPAEGQPAQRLDPPAQRLDPPAQRLDPPAQRLEPPPAYPPPPGYPAGWVVPGQRYAAPPAGYAPPPPPALARNGQPLASFTDRLLAYLIDVGVFLGVFVVLFVPAAVATLVLVLPDDPYAEPDPFQVVIPILLLELGFVVLALALQYLYYVEYLRRTGQTLGKKAMKIRVIPIDPAGRLDRGMAFKRDLVQTVAGAFIPMFNYIDGLWQLWDKPFQQCLHDKFAQTVVVKVVP
jgi:uncharacterized RDD family membrane protein YckC